MQKVSDDLRDERLNRIERRMDMLTENIENLARSVTQLVQHMDKHTTALLAIIQNRVPDASISLATHKSIVVALIWAFTTTLGVVLGAKELLNYLHAI